MNHRAEVVPILILGGGWTLGIFEVGGLEALYAPSSFPAIIAVITSRHSHERETYNPTCLACFLPTGSNSKLQEAESSFSPTVYIFCPVSQ